MLQKQIAFLFAAALITSPVAAADSAQTAQTAEKSAKPKKYCIQEATTGTRMTNKVCKTKSDWDKDGVDIDAADSKK